MKSFCWVEDGSNIQPPKRDYEPGEYKVLYASENGNARIVEFEEVKLKLVPLMKEWWEPLKD